MHSSTYSIPSFIHSPLQYSTSQPKATPSERESPNQEFSISVSVSVSVSVEGFDAKPSQSVGRRTTKIVPGKEVQMSRQMEFHYINTGFPYTVTESFMNFFDGLTYNLSDFSFPSLMPDQESVYWPMHTVSNKFGLSGVGNVSYHEYSYAYGLNSHVTRTVEERRAFDNSSLVNHEDWDIPNMERGEASSTISQSVPEECIRSHDNGSNSQVIWQDDIDPDNMTYEELLDLGEAVGTQSRGLSPEIISSLPISKCKHGNFFSRKKSRERCVICQMEYKRRDRQMTLPCKHVYHASCGSRWLTINKACPVCYAEVTGEDTKQGN